MKNRYRLAAKTLTAVLIVFCVLFATPFLSLIASRSVVQWTGCEAEVFNLSTTPCLSSGSSIRQRFAPLTIWISSVISPLIFFQQFWDVLATGAAAILGLHLLGHRAARSG